MIKYHAAFVKRFQYSMMQILVDTEYDVLQPQWTSNKNWSSSNSLKIRYLILQVSASRVYETLYQQIPQHLNRYSTDQKYILMKLL